jgi:hypothetical protein
LLKRIFFTKDLIKLQQCRYGKDRADDPIERMLIVFDPVSHELTAEDKNAITQERATANAQNVKIILQRVGRNQLSGK